MWQQVIEKESILNNLSHFLHQSLTMYFLKISRNWSEDKNSLIGAEEKSCRENGLDKISDGNRIGSDILENGYHPISEWMLF